MRSSKSSTAVCSDDQAVQVFTVTHPFHPLRGQQFTLTARRQNWGEARVVYFNGAGRLCSMPTSWTSVADVDHFEIASAGRSWFRIDDLLELSALMQTLNQTGRSRRRGVK